MEIPVLWSDLSACEENRERRPKINSNEGGKLMRELKKVVRRIASLPILVLPLFVAHAPSVRAANGDLIATVNFSQDCASGIGVGIAFDGKDLWYSCAASNPDLLRADPTTGTVVASYNIVGGLGALAYDATRNAIWAGPGGGSDPGGTILSTSVEF
jgi:hypothetical protein